jgi:riboflavin kinase/FMN adenylyltransferase
MKNRSGKNFIGSFMSLNSKHSIPQAGPALNSVITIGTFDGVHQGHQAIIRETCRLAQQRNRIPTAITFPYPPRLFFNPSPEPYLLTDILEKQTLLKSFGIQKVMVFDFNRNFSKLSPESFFKKIILGQCRASAVVVGYDFRFGSERSGDIHLLKKMGEKHSIQVTVIPPLQDRKKVPISSGRIRGHLQRGELKQASALLGHPYFLIGKVVGGAGLGKTLGFPTANLQIHPFKIAPEGVFAVRAEVLKKTGSNFSVVKKLKGMCNIGFRPTLHASVKTKTIEVHLFHFSGSLYGKTLKIEFIRKLRSEMKFKSLPALKKQLIKDKVQSMKLLADAS